MIRTRFAPSPTGYLHVGGVRTALFAWLVANQAKGQFYLRIEDTDKAREVEGSEQHILECLEWLGIDWDGEIIKQSQRLEIYKEWAQKLVDSGRAYADPYSPQELEGFRQEAKRQKKPFLFRDHRPVDPPKWDGTRPLRFKSDPKSYKWRDEVMGELQTGPEVVDDFIILKTDGYPTYNFAHVVDDHLMEITHVIRTQEFLPSVPKFLNLYEALEINHPALTTLPYVMGPDGKKKLSKRDGAKDILDYKKDGYLPEALVNLLATLGWNDGTDQEIYSRDELLQKFSLDRVQKSGARFDEKRLEWMNGHYIRQKPLGGLYGLSEAFWPPSAKDKPDDYKKQVLGLVQERLKHLSELPLLTGFFFEELPVKLELIDDNKQLAKLGREGQRGLLQKALEKLQGIDFSSEQLTGALNNLLEETGQKPGVLFSMIRIATTWALASPGLADTLALLGKDEILKRLQRAISALE
jgi:glutamyl-tRNA synthetase